MTDQPDRVRERQSAALKANFWRHVTNLSASGFTFTRALVPELGDAAATYGQRPECRVLDFGCGPKPYAFMFEGAAAAYVGVDVYPGADVDIVYDGGRLPFADRSFDYVFSSSVLEHVEDLPTTLREFGRILRPGGRVVWVVPFLSHTHGTPYDFHRPTRFGWLAFARANLPGFEVEVVPLDGRTLCLANIITSQVNFAFYNLLRALNRLVRGGPDSRAADVGLAGGAASPETAAGSVRLAYRLAELNPLNALIGFAGWLLERRPVAARSFEGEIASGFMVICRNPPRE